MPVNILTSADLHLGRTSATGGDDGTGLAVRQVWQELVDYCLAQGIHALVLSGDIVNQENKYFEALGPLENGLRRLDAAGIHVIITAGNHDYDVLPRLLSQNNFQRVYFLGKGGGWEQKELSINELEFRFIGWSFPAQHVKEDPLSTFPAEWKATNKITIGLLHGDIFDATSPYAPLNSETLKTAGADVWVLGHIHKPEILNDSRPLIYYPGSPQALSPKETGVHGAQRLTIRGKGTIEITPVAFSAVRYEKAAVDITGKEQESDWEDAVAEGIYQFARSLETGPERLKFLVLDITLTGRQKDIARVSRCFQSGEYEKLSRDFDGIRIVVRRVVNNCTVEISDLEGLKEEPTPAGLLAGAILDLEAGKDSGFLADLRREMYERVDGLFEDIRTYEFLRQAGDSYQLTKTDMDGMLLEECRRLLSELIRTREAAAS